VSIKFNPRIRQRLSQAIRLLVNKPAAKPSPKRASSSKSSKPSPRRQEPSKRLPAASSSEPPRKLRPRRKKPAFTLVSCLKSITRNTKKALGNTLGNRRPRFWLLMGVGVGFSSSAIALGAVVYQMEKGIPNAIEDVATYAPPGTITVKAADGSVLREIGHVSHEKLKFWQIPQIVRQAFIASEDRRFQDHRGVDLQGIARAVMSNVQAGGVVQGGSTITQQLARIVFLNQDRNFGRKYKEMRLARAIEDKYSKDQILERYLNLVYLGSGAYGIADAAWLYFSKPVSDLTLAEAATLAGIVPAPSVYSPPSNPKAAKDRRNQVLRKMQAQGIITASEAEAAIASPLEIKPNKLKRQQRQAPYFTEYVEKELPKYVSQDLLQAGGVIVETTIDPKWQKSAEEIIDSTVENNGKWQRFKQAAMVAIDPRSGQIKALVGGTDYYRNQFDRVTQAKRQPGSTFKTFVYATAIAAGFSPYRSFLDAEYVVDGYKPENYGDKYSDSQVSLRTALAKSLNTVAVQLLIKVGWDPVIKTARAMGIESEMQPTYSLALGSWEVTLLELTSAYGTLANQGTHQKAYGISRVLDRKGNVLYQAKAQPKEAIDPDSAAIMTWMLRGVVESGTGIPAQIGRPVAGKTGTSDKVRDLWFVGYIPQLVTGIWLGNDDNKPTYSTSAMAASVWRKFMLEATEEMPIESFSDLPNQIEGRKGTLAAAPLKPQRTSFKYTARKRESTVATTSGSTTTRSYRRSRRSTSSYSSGQSERRVYRPRRSNRSTASTPRNETVRVRKQPPAAAPRQTNESTRSTPPTFAPPAPPASRKDD
jgi:penicillin-binding protein 1A